MKMHRTARTGMLLAVLALLSGCGGGGEAPPAPPTIDSFTATPPSVILGGGTTLAWSVSGATSVTLDQGLGAQSGDNAAVTPAGPATTYTLTASGTAGTVRSRVTVPVNCTVTFVAGAGGRLSGTTAQVVPWGGSGTAVAAVPDPGRDFAGWSGGGLSGASNPVTVDNVTGNLTITANFGYPDLAAWLGSHPNVAAAIKWQFRPGSPSNWYAPPAEADKAPWAAWSQPQKDELDQAYLDACAWLDAGATQVAIPSDGLTDAPVNLHPQTSDNTLSTLERVAYAYARKLYVAHVAFSLALETTARLPWSIAGYPDPALRYLFDSSTMAINLPDNTFGMGTYGGANLPPLRANNLPRSAFAPPRWTYPFLRQAGIVRADRLSTIGGLLDWMRGNMVHFYGADTFGTANAVWQYRGYPPLSRIVGGTVDANNPGLGVQHWTAGCHGSVGFLCAALRVLNIPVQPVWVCGHELAYFPTENLYLDHGDDPYNANVKGSAAPSLSILIDEPTYGSWFTNDPAANILDIYSPACANVGRRAAEIR